MIRSLFERPHIRLAFFYAVVFSVFGIHMPYWPVWLAAHGIDKAAIGLLVAVGTGVRLMAQPAIGHVADATGERKRVILACLVAMAGAFALFPLGEGFWQYLIVTALFGMTASPIVSLLDTLTMHGVREQGLNYGRIRLWGSIAFLVGALGFGIVLERTGSDWIWRVMFALCLCSIAAGFVLPDWRQRRTAARTRAPLRELLGDRPLVAFIAAAGCGQASHALYYAYGTLHWQAAGLSDAFIGFLWAEGVVAEILFFTIGDRLFRRFGLGHLLALSGAAGILRWLVLGFTAEPAILIAVQLTHGLTFGANFQATVLHLAQTVPPDKSASAQSLNSVISTGILLAGTQALAGPLYGWFGGYAYCAMALLSAVTLIHGLRKAVRNG